MRARWYDPRVGQFLSEDPMGFVDSYNPYAFVSYDPINHWDPWGLQGNTFVQGLRDNARRHINDAKQLFQQDASELLGGAKELAREKLSNWWKGHSEGHFNVPKLVEGLAGQTGEVYGAYVMGDRRKLGDKVLSLGKAVLAAALSRKLMSSVSPMSQSARGKGVNSKQPRKNGDKTGKIEGIKACRGPSCNKDGVCFVAGTPVLLANDEQKAIDEMEVGDVVKTQDALSMPQPHENKRLVVLLLDLPEKGSRIKIIVSDRHKMRTAVGLQTVSSLKVGMRVMVFDDAWAVVISIQDQDIEKTRSQEKSPNSD